MEKYTNKEIPDENTLRKNYVNDIYVETMNKIRFNIVGHKIWISVDETTDVQGRYIANVIIAFYNGSQQTWSSLSFKLRNAREDKFFDNHKSL